MSMTANAVGKSLSEAERAYLTGLLDADSAIMAVIERHSEKRHGFRIRVVWKITQRDDHILNALQKEWDLGQMRKNRDAYDWRIRDQKQVGEMLTMLAPYVRVKSRQIALAREILQTERISMRGLMRAAKLADTLSSFNVRSNGRRKNYSAMIQESLSCND